MRSLEESYNRTSQQGKPFPCEHLGNGFSLKFVFSFGWGRNGRCWSNVRHLFIPWDVQGWCCRVTTQSKILGLVFCWTGGPCVVPISIWMTAYQEIRNGHCSRLLCALVQSRTFKTANHSHLVVGHTHEDVDAVLSLVKRALDSESILLTPRDMMRAITKKLTPMYEEQGMMFKTIWVETVTWIKLISWFVFFMICLKTKIRFTCDHRFLNYSEGPRLGEPPSWICADEERIQGSQAETRATREESAAEFYLCATRRPFYFDGMEFWSHNKLTLSWHLNRVSNESTSYLCSDVLKLSFQNLSNFEHVRYAWWFRVAPFWTTSP